jgi:hypothetical protein
MRGVDAIQMSHVDPDAGNHGSIHLAVLVALLAFPLWWILWQSRLRDGRDAFLAAAISWAGYLVVMTEALSRVTRISFPWVLAGWIVADAAMMAVMARAWWQWRKQATFAGEPKRPREPISDACSLAWSLATPLGVIGVTLAVVALIGPPSNFDAMVYHMPRVIHWIENHNVAFYPTSIPRQLEMPPGAEYIILHLQLLSGGDQLANMVQWFAWCGCIIGASAVARLLGAKEVGQAIAAVTAGTLPMACLQAVTTQNDLVAALWVIAFFWSVLRLITRGDNPGICWLNVLLCAVALGLAMLTKTTDFIYAAPAVLALTVGLFWQYKWKAPAALAAVAIVAVAINAPFVMRNLRFTHTLLGNGGQALEGNGAYINTHRDLAAVASNYLRNAGLELIVPWDTATGDVEQCVRAVHRWLGLDPDDPGTTWQLDTPQFQLRAQLWDTEDNASNPIQFVLILMAAVLIAIHWRASWPAVLYGCGILLAITAFCLELRWQEWHARLHVPIMVASAPLVGIALERYMNRRLAIVLAGLLPWLAVPVIAQNYNHPLVGDRAIIYHDHDTRYFLAHPAMQYPFVSIVDIAAAHHCRQVGLMTEKNDWEYPLDMMLRARLPDVAIEFYPGPDTLRTDQLHTRNKGWDEAIRPYIVVKISGESASVVKIVDQ